MSFLINFEGIHGCGKTTQARLLERDLTSRGLETEYISSADKPLSRYAMDFLKKTGPQDSETLFFLALANNFSLMDRFQHPTKLFILDRYLYTDMASTHSAGKDLSWIIQCISPFRYPDVAFFLDLPAEEALKRKNLDSNHLENGAYQRGAEIEGFIQYQTRLRQAYKEIAERDARLIVLDGTKHSIEIHKEVMEIFNRKFSLDDNGK